MIRGLSGEACSDSTLVRGDVLERFRTLARTGQPRTAIRILELKELSGTLGTAAIEQTIPFDTRLSVAMQRLFALSDANHVRKYVAHDVADLQPEQSDVDDILRISREDYDKPDQCQVCRFDAMQGILSTLLNTLPAGNSLEEVIEEEIGFIELNPVEEVSPPAWLLVFEQVLNTSRPADRETQKKLEDAALQGKTLILTPSEEAARIRLRLAASSDPAIRIFWQAEKVLKPPYHLVMPEK